MKTYINLAIAYFAYIMFATFVPTVTALYAAIAVYAILFASDFSDTVATNTTGLGMLALANMYMNSSSYMLAVGLIIALISTLKITSEWVCSWIEGKSL